MSEEDGFLRAILASPGDAAVRLVYADWLEDRADPRAEYLRLGARLAGLAAGDEAAAAARRRMLQLRPQLPLAWLARLGDYHSSSGSGPDAGRAEQVAAALGRPVRYVDAEGYERHIVAAAPGPRPGPLAYVECRSQQREDYLDIRYRLHVRDGGGQEAAWELKTYNPYFGCDVRFLEWYGDAVLVIYREKRRTYVCRFGPDCPAEYKAIEDYWALDGHHLGYWGYQETRVSRLGVPGLEELPSLSAEEAARWGLLPRRFW
jgi:uncharacterized protein (TIGR02996 family)